ncbi:hypothetical protein [Microvirga pudoricolor]|uniref:hypothetical protein n=1 Tax=Microvirga pudoricolor TaxID=2778729 RepID=UPI00194E7561|nr:hypothetical protein [Microvirga pudoricolor]MBM6596764.1 hypothetical protein [Microvirga pudoricolor]
MEFIVSALGGDGGDGGDGMTGAPGLNGADGANAIVISSGGAIFDGAGVFEHLFEPAPTPVPADLGLTSPAAPTDFWIL